MGCHRLQSTSERIQMYKASGVKVFWIDLFCGAGGTSTGIHLAKAKAKAEVIACVNHDKIAIQSHEENHPFCLHLIENVRDFRVVYKLKSLIDQLRREIPDCVINIWASLECTNYSKAKGGLPRDADSRTLAHALFMYIEHLNPNYIYIENVREFMAWGPLNKTGRPMSRKNGADYVKWINKVQSYGYNYDYKLLNSADFGAYTSRERYFGIFAKKGMLIKWPEATHAKKLPKSDGMFPGVKKLWKSVREVLDLEDEGKSIFERKKPLSENTLKRIYAGLIKFVANGDDTFIKKYYSGRPAGKVISINGPAGTIKTVDGQAIVKTVFLSTYYKNGSNYSSESPAPTITTKDRISKVEAKFLDQQYSKSKPIGIENPAGTLTTTPKLNLVTAKPWLMNYNSSTAPPNDIDNPCPTITSVRTHYLLNPQYRSKGSSLENPCFTLIARMDKAPPYLVSTEHGEMAIVIYDTDSSIMVKIKEFMALYGIVDIKMRMLKIMELLRIQGFPTWYKLKGTKTQQKKFIGNSVVPLMAQKLVESNCEAVEDYFIAA